ncbi:uncharacterized protein LOC129589694 isoform X2 [Paramacrobiotus metropolitanus]|nr:uncharacterized protein LOC129589694 isoform X2 [Paramacrobiotus metropolitanus]
MRPLRKQKLPPIEDLKLKNTTEGTSDVEDIDPSECETTATQYYRLTAQGRLGIDHTPKKSKKYCNVLEPKAEIEEEIIDRNPKKKTDCANVAADQQNAAHSHDGQPQEAAGICAEIPLGQYKNVESEKNCTQPYDYDATPDKPEAESHPVNQHDHAVDGEENRTEKGADQADVPGVVFYGPFPKNLLTCTLNSDLPTKRTLMSHRKRGRSGSSCASDGVLVIPATPDAEIPGTPAAVAHTCDDFDLSDDEMEDVPCVYGNMVNGISFLNNPVAVRPKRTPSPVNTPVTFSQLTQNSLQDAEELEPTQVLLLDENGDPIPPPGFSQVPEIQSTPRSEVKDAAPDCIIDRCFRYMNFETPLKTAQFVLADDTPESQYRNSFDRDGLPDTQESLFGSFSGSSSGTSD